MKAVGWHGSSSLLSGGLIYFVSDMQGDFYNGSFNMFYFIEQL
jgi:hypothetical protein